MPPRLSLSLRDSASPVSTAHPVVFSLHPTGSLSAANLSLSPRPLRRFWTTSLLSSPTGLLLYLSPFKPRVHFTEHRNLQGCNQHPVSFLRAPPPAFQAPSATSKLRVGDLEHSGLPESERVEHGNLQGCHQQPVSASPVSELRLQIHDCISCSVASVIEVSEEKASECIGIGQQFL